MVNAAINGFGRIGRLLYRAALETNADINFVAVNDLTDAKTLAHLLKNDTVHGKFPFDVEVKGSSLIVDGKELKILAEPDPSKLPWKEMGVYVAVESTGRFRSREAVAKHLEAGAEKVLVSAPMSPAKSADLTVVYGVNDNLYDPNKHKIMSLASCTTNCLAPVAKVLNDNFGIEKGLMTTVHAVTNDQRLLDMQHSDLRRARAAAFNMIPTSTGAATAVGLVLPVLDGKLNGMALRVPIPDVSIVDLVAILKKEATKDEINAALKNAVEGSLKGVLSYTEEPLVSSDLIHNPNSAIIDGDLTMVIGNLVKVLAWYDNEWGYSVKMVHMIEKICKMAA
ncbi:MAG: type I glyceraldehyde-3-phosphate dehydrogenase [Candidatus Bathyarchaeota archaeon]|nr:type I glyceraldehyde-3-phosphate dehydrogenase [Candidatus Bathyarchaeum tardum]WGM90221.1 MAG: type I glyceraldehyde-3-phosphate dehydrogenase [Candidatus Bathyarchaeum tardum]WNZ29693.1 MAG: type I glyceraldehyde-3-phosphate dehydrogenase [Candidatus Bathyarchaeota archaeon]